MTYSTMHQGVHWEMAHSYLESNYYPEVALYRLGQQLG